MCVISKLWVNSNWNSSPETLNSGQNRRFCLSVWPRNMMDDLEKQYDTFSILHQALCNIPKSYVNSNLSYSPKTLSSGQIQRLFVLCDLEIWQMTLKNYRAPLLCYFKLFALFRSHWWIETAVTVTAQFWSKSTIFQPGDLQIWWMTVQKIGHLI